LRARPAGRGVDGMPGMRCGAGAAFNIVLKIYH
jgi:hypothetical protein